MGIRGKVTELGFIVACLLRFVLWPAQPHLLSFASGRALPARPRWGLDVSLSHYVPNLVQLPSLPEKVRWLMARVHRPDAPRALERPSEISTIIGCMCDVMEPLRLIEQ